MRDEWREHNRAGRLWVQVVLFLFCWVRRVEFTVVTLKMCVGLYSQKNSVVYKTWGLVTRNVTEELK